MTVSKQIQDGTLDIWIISASGWLFKKKSIMIQHGNTNVKSTEQVLLMRRL